MVLPCGIDGRDGIKTKHGARVRIKFYLAFRYGKKRDFVMRFLCFFGNPFAGEFAGTSEPSSLKCFESKHEDVFVKMLQVVKK